MDFKGKSRRRADKVKSEQGQKSEARNGMDPKASAKSKRTHSQQVRRAHPTHAASAAQRKKPGPPGGGGGGEQRPHQAHPHALPSNWDRYDDEEGEAEAPTAAQIAGEVAPKSKGADFRYLVEQARANPPQREPQCSSSFDELPFDFMQGMSSLLSVRGKSLLSQCGDDNFIVDDEPTLSFEVPFLPMDLHALATQLSKLKISERLFIEADLFPEEQHVDQSENSKVSEQPETAEISESKHGLEPPAIFSDLKLEKNVDNLIDCGTSFKNPGVILSQPSTTDADRLVPTIDSNQAEKFSESENQELISQLSKPTFTVSKPNNMPGFMAAEAEAELDMLLGSFVETTLSSSRSDGLREPTTQNATYAFLAADIPPLPRPEPSSSKYEASNPLDDEIDDLLAETSTCYKHEKQKTFTQKEGVAPSVNLPPNSSTVGSGHVDDFDSWLDTL